MEKRLTVFDMLQPKSQPTKIIFKMLFFQLRLQNRHLFNLCFLFFQLCQFFLQCLGTWTRNQSVHCSLYLFFNLIQPFAAVWFSIHIRGIDLVQSFRQCGNLLFCEKGLQGIYHHLLQFVCMNMYAVFCMLPAPASIIEILSFYRRTADISSADTTLQQP